MRLEVTSSLGPTGIARVLSELEELSEHLSMEAAPLSPWSHFGLLEAGGPTLCIVARYAKAADGADKINHNWSLAQKWSGSDMLVLHHGLLLREPVPITARRLIGRRTNGEA